MNPELRGIWEHMRDVGLGALAHANRHAAYVAMENGRWPELAVLQAAHAAELLIKARIAQEHPLLIFDQLPKASQAAGTHLDLPDLFKQGRTVQWSDLPDRLWASTGITLPDKALWDHFGKLRNGIQHFGPAASGDPGGDALRFVFSVIDPFIHEWWGLFAVDYDEDDDPYIYFVTALVGREIPFLVSPEAAERFDDWSVEWDKATDEYALLMHARVTTANAKRGS
jgi:hypothetical protein